MYVTPRPVSKGTTEGLERKESSRKEQSLRTRNSAIPDFQNRNSTMDATELQDVKEIFSMCHVAYALILLGTFVNGIIMVEIIFVSAYLSCRGACQWKRDWSPATVEMPALTVARRADNEVGFGLIRLASTESLGTL